MNHLWAEASHQINTAAMMATNTGPAQLKSAAVFHGQNAGAKKRRVMMTTQMQATVPTSFDQRPRLQGPGLKALPARSRRKIGMP